MQRFTPLIPLTLALAACDPEAPADDAPVFRGEVLECVAPDELYTPIITEQATLRSPHDLEIHDGTEVVIDEKNNVVYLDNDQTYSCHCDAGCGGSVCTLEITDTIAVCRGTCDGVTSDDGSICWGCEWHQAPALDPTAGGGDPKLPGDPSPGEVDPTGFDLPPFEPHPGELDPTH